MNIYARMLKKYKEKNLLTNKQIAQLLNIDTSSVSKILNGTTQRIKAETKEKIANLLQISIDDISEDMDVIKKPLLGIVKAGYDLLADENIEEYYPVTKDDDLKGDYFLRVTGDSMEPLIHENDLLYIKQCNSVSNYSIAIVMIGEEVTVKKVIIKDDLFILEAINPTVDNMYFTPKQVSELPVRVIGKVIYSRSDFD